jgi:hypothetical protein
MTGMTFAQMDALKAEREAKKRELVDRLAKLLGRSLSFEELRLIEYADGAVVSPVLIEAFALARNATRK